ncbi:permease prefix domain 1-containing protein [Catellatospora sichuanensis]|uniref:permease prefix domain 1-containing protein n=1 Tax=Catellatospora sichuanensis TaxID=1969805 RepID=UPI00118355F1|nr:permease prefix domain 1-containing protein [Catellatospora sichuanensis]
MDTFDLTPAAWDPRARAAVAGYLQTIAAGLPLTRRARAEVMAEIADGLACAVEAHIAAGATTAAAARLSVAEFGDPRELSAALAAEIAWTHARRLGRALVATGPLVGLAWVGAFAQASGMTWWSQIGVLMASAPAYPLVLAVSVPAALVAAGVVRLAGRPAFGATTAVNAAVVASAACVVGDIALVIGLATQPGDLAWTAALACAVPISLVRMGVTAAAGRRALLLRAAVR